MHSRAFVYGAFLTFCLACRNDGKGDDTTFTGPVITSAGSAETGDQTTGAPTSDTEPTGGSESAESSSDDGQLVCDMQDFVLEAVPPNVMLVLDKSGSMVQQSWDADNDPSTPNETRWRSLHQVVEFVVTTFENEINFGANLFPSEAAATQLGAAACPVRSNPEVPVQKMNAENILATIPPANEVDGIEGATPATAGIQAALDHLLTLDPGVDRFMILITDGAANCGANADTSMCPGLGCGLMEEYDDQLPAVVGTAFTEHNVPTFVVGIDIQNALVGQDPMDGQTAANTYVELNAVAEAGGRARAGSEKFFNTVNEVELMEALSTIAGQVVSCTIPFEEEPEHPAFVKIEIGGVEIPKVNDCATEDGWVYTNPMGPYDAIQLCGTACDMLAEVRELDAIFECPPNG